LYFWPKNTRLSSGILTLTDHFHILFVNCSFDGGRRGWHKNLDIA
jgi:hypothetical protein